VAAHRLGQVEAYLTVREVLSEASTVADGVLSSERSDFYRRRYATLGLTFLTQSVLENLLETMILNPDVS
jgi:hypothetical protein